jgi:hypothetical protein
VPLQQELENSRTRNRQSNARSIIHLNERIGCIEAMAMNLQALYLAQIDWVTFPGQLIADDGTLETGALTFFTVAGITVSFMTCSEPMPNE